MAQNILLVEPNYKNKYPPLGLMKISQYHKQKGDNVEFIKGLSRDKRDKIEWDRIYVSSLFTYDWKITVETLKYYRYSVKDPISENLIVGGVLATLMADDLQNEIGCRVVKGLLDTNGKLGYEDDGRIDSLVADYEILREIDYQYPTSNAYILYATRGCIRNCEFCAVPIIEPSYKDFISLTEQVLSIRQQYGPKRDLLLLDNNVLASNKFQEIIAEIKSLGFKKGAKFKYKGKNGSLITVKCSVDFNQGLDARLLTEEKMSLLSEIEISPLRIAFDSINYKDLYEEKIRLAAKYNIKYLSNYILYNFKDKPEDLYNRLRINVELNEELGLQIYSFPMRFIDQKNKNRLVDTPGNIGEFWNKKYLRAIQCILNVTRGVVGTKLDFFKEAFGKDIDEYFKILLMPEDYILNRHLHLGDGSTELWWNLYNKMNFGEKEQLKNILYNYNIKEWDTKNISPDILKIMEHYTKRDNEKEDYKDK